MGFLNSFSISVITILGIVNNCHAAIQCDPVTPGSCGRTNHKRIHILPTTLGSTYCADGFHGGTMYVKYQTAVQSLDE